VKKVMIEKKEEIFTTKSFPLLKNVYHTRLIIPVEKTVSGMSYSFEVGEVKSILIEDKEYLLSLSKHQSSCCGGVLAKNLFYFEEVK
jgi:hypothetical protein